MNRVKAVYRSWSIPCGGRDVYYKRNRDGWLSKFPIDESRLRTNLYYTQLDLLKEQRRDSKKIFLKEARRYPAERILRTIPGFGPLRSALAISLKGTPHRIRTERQLWSYSGLSVVVHSTSDHDFINGRIIRRHHKHSTRGLTRDFNRILKAVYKGAATEAIRRDPFDQLYKMKVAKGIRPEMALLLIARRIAAISLILWKGGVNFDVAKLLTSQ
jgi:transposase